jgi:hypothetical protein
MEEAGELAFLVSRKASADDNKLGGIALIQQDLLGVVSRLELLHLAGLAPRDGGVAASLRR